MNNQREIDRYEAMERAIDEEIEQAQEIKKKRTIKNTTGHDSNCCMRYAFSSKICCGFCGTNYTRKGANKRVLGLLSKTKW